MTEETSCPFHLTSVPVIDSTPALFNIAAAVIYCPFSNVSVTDVAPVSVFHPSGKPYVASTSPFALSANTFSPFLSCTHTFNSEPFPTVIPFSNE